MHPGGEEYSFFLLPIVEVTNYDIIAVITRNSLAQSFSLDKMLASGVLLDFVQVSLQLRVSVGVAMSDVDRITIIYVIAIVLHGNLMLKLRL